MTRQQIIEQFIEYLDQHLKGLRGAVSQEPYRGDFFELFRTAYRNGYFDTSDDPALTGDHIAGILAERWMTGDQDDDKKARLMQTVLPKWDEWRYAWDQLRKEGHKL